MNKMPYEYLRGKVSRLYASGPWCKIRLDKEGDRYFVLSKNHENYNAIYSLILTAAFSRRQVILRLEDYPEGGTPSDDVRYVVVDFP